jgi:ADP-heptose:LPS heptosyltransferase
MAQTWPVSKRRIGALKFVDLIGRVSIWPFRRRSGTGSPRIERVLVIEPWNIGDVVLATPLLMKLRERFPTANITLLARDYARQLLDGSGLVDEVIVANLPWTAPGNKYRITRAVAKEMRNLVRQLRKKRFNVTIDARMDIRSNFLAAATGAPRRVGYSIGGGGWLLTDALPSDRDDSHKIDDWLALMQCLQNSEAVSPTRRISPKLVVDRKEREAAAKALAAVAGDASPTIGYHPGGSHPGKRWPRAQFRELMTQLRTSIGGRHVVFLGPEEEHADGWPAGVAVMRPSLRHLMAQVSCCDVFVCNDSGPMHIADALGVPVVAIFEIGNPQWFGPSGSRSIVVRGELAGIGLSAAPLDRPPRNPVAVSRVAEAVNEVLRS